MNNISKKALASLLSVAVLLGTILLPNIARVRAADAAPAIGDRLNLVCLDDTAFFADGTNYGPLDLSQTVKGDAWYLSVTVNFSKAAAWEGPELAFATGTVTQTGTDDTPSVAEDQMIRVQIRNTDKAVGQYLLNRAAEPMYTYGNTVLSGEVGFGFEENKDYRVTIAVSERDKLSLWVDDAKLISGQSLAALGITDLQPCIGWRCYVSAGTMKHIQVWDDISEKPTFVKELTLVDADVATDGTLAKYDLLGDPTKGLTLNEGDTYVFDMDILAKNHHNGGTAKPFGFDLLGNPTKSDNGAEIKLAGVEFANKNALYWIANGAWNEYMDQSQPFTIWGGGNYHYRFTVKAYESIRVEFCYSEGYNAEKKGFDATVAWDQVYGLSAAKPGDGTLFYPNLAFLDQDGKVSNITMRHSSGNKDGTVATVEKITLEDTDKATDGTLAKYDLLEDPTSGLAMEVGETYVFDMDILAKNHYNGGTARPFGFDLLGNPTKSDNGAEIKLAGVEFANKNALYWIANGAWNVYMDQSQPFIIWGGGNYHYRFTVKAYESIRVEFCYSEGYNAEKKGFDATVAWDKVYGLSAAKPGDGTLFYPNLAFLDQDGEVTNIQCTYTREIKPPVIGENDTDLAKDRELPDSFAGGEDTVLDLGKVVPTTDGNSWNYSATFRYDRFGGEYSGLNAIFAEGTYNGKRQNLMISAKAHKQGETVTGTKLVLRAGADGTVLHEVTLPDTVYATGVDYTLTVRVSGGKVSFWINDDILLENFDPAAAGVTDLLPKFGFNADGTTGTISAIHVWGDIDRSTVPEMGADDVDIIGDRKVPTEFVSNNMTLDLGKLVTSKDNASWIFSGKFTYTKLTNYSGLNITFADCLYKGGRRDLTVAARVHMENDKVTDTQILLWTGVNGDVLHIDGKGITYRTDREYVFTVRLQDGKVSFWIDHTLLIGEFDLTAKGVSALRPKFALSADRSMGTLSELHAWGDIERVLPATRPASAANLLQNCEEFLSFTPTIRSNYYDNSKIQVQGETWYYSGSYVYSGMAAYGGITPIFGEGTYTKPAGNGTAAITGTRELSVTARSGGFSGEVRQTQSVIWADGEPILVSGVSGLSLEIGKRYTWTVEMRNGLLTFWLDNTLVFNDVDLSAYGITNIRPKFGLLPDGSSGTLSDVQVWDEVTTDQEPVYTDKDINNAVLRDVKVTASLGRLLYEGVSYTDGGEYYYAATAKGNGVRLIVAKSGEATAETYYDGKTVYLVNHKGGTDTVMAKAAANVDTANGCRYTVKYSAGLVSVWVNDTLALSKVKIDGFAPAAGVAAASGAAGEVTDILLWGDASQVGGMVYQQFDDISAYRTGGKTYPAANGYVFGGWYQTAGEDKPVAESTVSGSAYAKLVPASVLSVKTKTQKDITYSSDKSDLRFVTTVDSLSYRNIGIRLSCDGKTRTFSGKDVYKVIGTADNEEKWNSPKMAFGSDSLYYFTVKVKNVNQPNAVWTATPCWTTLDGTEVVGVTNEVAVNDKFGKRIEKEQLDLNGNTLLQISSSKNIMSYVIRTKDGKTVVIDGGTKDDAEYLVWVLKNRYGVSAVDAWYVTHEDENHYGALESILDSGSLAINKVYYNFLEGSTGTFKAKLDAAANAEVIGRTVHTYGGVAVRVINDHRDYAGAANTADKATMVLLAEFGGSKNTGVLFLGDLTKETEAYVLRQAQDAGVDITGKAVQVDNHGGIACSRAFYEQLQPKVCLWPCVRGTWENNAELRTFLYGVGVWTQYSSVSENIEFH